MAEQHEHERELHRKHLGGTYYAVAAVNRWRDRLNWAAYMGPWDDQEQVASHGIKMAYEVAILLFPDLPAEDWRR